MKKSKLRNIIRESIKELMTEQELLTEQPSSVGCFGGSTCDNRTLVNPSGPYMSCWIQNNLFDFIRDTYGPTANFNDYYFNSTLNCGTASGWCGNGNCCDPTSNHQYMRSHSINSGNQHCGPHTGWQANTFQDFINEVNTMMQALNLPATFTINDNFFDVYMQVYQATGGTTGSTGCMLSFFCSNCCGGGNTNLTQVGCHDQNAFNYDSNGNGCDDGTGVANPNDYSCCDYGFNCKQIGDHPKFGSKCVPGTSQNIGQFATQQDCIESGCEGLSPDKGDDIQQPFSPLTTTPQDMDKPEDDEIKRMQKIANIK